MTPSIPGGAAVNIEPASFEKGLANDAGHAHPRTRRRFWLLLAIALVGSVLFFPPPWHALIRGFLVQVAARHGCVLTIGRIRGGVFDTINLYDVRWQRRGTTATPTDVGTDLRIAHAELTFAWRLPAVGPSAPFVQRLVLDGLSGHWEFGAGAAIGNPPAVRADFFSGKWLDQLSSWLVPTNFFIRGDDLSLQRGRGRLRLRGLRVSGERDATGLLLAREVEIVGPGFKNTLLNRHGETLWHGDRLSINGLDFGPGVRLLSATLDGRHLQRQRLDWECSLTVLGGDIRSQGAVNFVHPRLALEIAGSLHRIPIAPLARLLGLAGPAVGLVDQGSFSFRGDPENWPAAEMWLAAQATNFRWGQRDWRNLELRATVLHQRIQVHRLELQQSRNRLSLTGECPLVPPDQMVGRWWEAGFACNVDARLDDLHALTQLFGRRLPELDGRMSINGTLASRPGRSGIDGYLNVEGSRLLVRGAPLDYLHSTLLFQGDELNVADLQATRREDYFAGRGSVSLTGAPRYQGEFRFSVTDPAIYAPALAGILDLEAVGLQADVLSSPVSLESVFYGPDLEGRTDFFTFGGFQQFPGLPVLPGGHGGDNWLGSTIPPGGRATGF